MSQLLDWLIKKLPPSPAPALIHNDFKMDNLMFNKDRIAIEAVLDWGMATVGDPLTDLGYALYYWGRMTDPASNARPFTTEAGWPTGDELVQYYALQTGRDVSMIRYYELFSVFKLAVIFQQIFVRFRMGYTADERFRNFNQSVRRILEDAVALL